MSCFLWCSSCCDDSNSVSKYSENSVVSSINHSLERSHDHQDEGLISNRQTHSSDDLDFDENNVPCFPSRIRKIIGRYLAIKGPSSDPKEDQDVNMAWAYYLSKFYSNIRTERSHFFMSKNLLELIEEIRLQTKHLYIPTSFQNQHYSDDFTTVLEKQFTHIVSLKINFYEFNNISQTRFPQFPNLKKLTIEDASSISMHDIGILLNFMPADSCDDDIYTLRFPKIKSLYLTQASKLMNENNEFSSEFIRYAKSIFLRNWTLDKIDNDGKVIVRCKNRESIPASVENSPTPTTSKLKSSTIRRHRRIVSLSTTTAEELAKSEAYKAKRRDSTTLQMISPARESCSLSVLELAAAMQNLHPFLIEPAKDITSINTDNTKTSSSISASESSSSVSCQSARCQ